MDLLRSRCPAGITQESESYDSKEGEFMFSVVSGSEEEQGQASESLSSKFLFPVEEMKDLLKAIYLS